MLFSSLLTLRLREVLSVVDQFLNVSKVNTLCITQVCKCFHYNTGFSLAIYRACLLRGQPHSAEPPEYLTHRHSLPTLQPGLLRAMTKQKYFTLGVGSAFCGSLNSGQSSDATSFTPRFSYASGGISKQRGGTQLEAWGHIKCIYCFPPSQ